MTAVLNEPSQAVMRRLGMTLYGHFDHPRVEAGHPVRPHVVYRIARPGRARRRGLSGMRSAPGWRRDRTFAANAGRSRLYRNSVGS
jgi:hypothetical protein